VSYQPKENTDFEGVPLEVCSSKDICHENSISSENEKTIKTKKAKDESTKVTFQTDLRGEKELEYYRKGRKNFPNRDMIRFHDGNVFFFFLSC
jgi:hypothetical protein